MKLIAYIEKTGSLSELEVTLNFYRKNPILNKFDISSWRGQIQIKKIIKLSNSKNFFNDLCFPSDDSSLVEVSYSSEINCLIEPMIDDALAQMNDQERYDFSEELFKNIKREIVFKGYEMDYPDGRATCYVEMKWRDQKKINPDSKNYAGPHLYIRYIFPPIELCCASHKLIISEEKARELFYRETFRNESNRDLVVYFSDVARPLRSSELAELVNFAPDFEEMEVAFDFVKNIIQSNPVDFSNPAWGRMIEYINGHKYFCIRKIVELQDFEKIKCISDIVKNYFKIIPISDCEDVANLMGLAPLPSNIIAASKFIKIISEVNGFEFSESVWIDFLKYIDEYKASCINFLRETERQDEYEVIRETSLNAFVWSGGVDQFRAILVERMKSGKVDSLKNTIHSFVLDGVCKSFLTHSSIEIVNDLIKNFSSSPHLYRSMSAENQLRIFNVYSAINCQKIFLNEESDEDKLAVNYATDRMMEVMRSVKFDAEKSIKKSFSILKKAEYRVAAALINKIVKDLDSYFAKPVVAEVYSALLLPNNPDRDWVAVCGILPSIQSNFAIREGLARQFLSIGDLEKAKPHIDAVVNFEPNSKTSIEIKALLAREEAIKSLVEDGVNVESIDQMTGVDFEKILIRKLQKIGFRVTETPGSGDYGADIILDDEDETRFIIQCKRFSSRVNLKAVQEVVAAMKHYSADYAIVATNNEFLKSAVELAKSNDVELWAGTKIMQVLSGDISETILATANLPKDVLNNSRA